MFSASAASGRSWLHTQAHRPLATSLARNLKPATPRTEPRTPAAARWSDTSRLVENTRAKRKKREAALNSGGQRPQPATWFVRRGGSRAWDIQAGPGSCAPSRLGHGLQGKREKRQATVWPRGKAHGRDAGKPGGETPAPARLLA